MVASEPLVFQVTQRSMQLAVGTTTVIPYYDVRHCIALGGVHREPQCKHLISLEAVLVEAAASSTADYPTYRFILFSSP